MWVRIAVTLLKILTQNPKDLRDVPGLEILEIPAT